MTRFLTFLVFLFLLAATGCSKDRLQRPDFNQLKHALLSGNPEEVESEINIVCSTVLQSEGSKADLLGLANAISGKSSMKAEVLCYNCIYTSPAQSEIRISISAQGIQKDKIIDISYSNEKKLMFAGMHD